MVRLFSIHILLVVLFGAAQLPSQEPVKSSQVFGDLNPEKMNLVSESRRRASGELGLRSTPFNSPDIAASLQFGYPIAIARITAVQPPGIAMSPDFWISSVAQPPGGGAAPRTRISFEVQQMLRGEPNVTSFDVESRWVPEPPERKEEPLVESFGSRGTVLDRTEPKVGDLYIVGYTFPYGNARTAFVPSVIDLQDPAQAHLIGEMEQFLRIESSAGDLGFAPYLAALDSSIPWIRGIAVRRLTSSDACMESAVCAERFAAVVRRQLQSSLANERLEALFWMVWVDSVSRSQREQKG